MKVLSTSRALSHPPQHKTVKSARTPPFRDYLEKLFGQVSYQNVKDVKVNRGTTS